jgi:hypothetical protein
MLGGKIYMGVKIFFELFWKWLRIIGGNDGGVFG